MSENTEHRRSDPQDYDPTPCCVVCFKAWYEPGGFLRPEAYCPTSVALVPRVRISKMIEYKTGRVAREGAIHESFGRFDGPTGPHHIIRIDGSLVAVPLTHLTEVKS